MTVYQVWAVMPGKEDELLETFEHEYQADYVCTELNIASTDLEGEVPPDYRVLKVGN